MGLLTWYRKRRALYQYYAILGTLLIDRYGYEPTYSWKRVQATLDKQHLSREFAEYAYAMYCSEEEFLCWCDSLLVESPPARDNSVVSLANPYRLAAVVRRFVRKYSKPEGRAKYQALREEVAARLTDGDQRFLTPKPTTTASGAPSPGNLWGSGVGF